MLTENLVSILLPVYNAAQTIAACIESVLQSSYSHFELLIVDDGSTDESAEIIRAFCERDTRIVLIRESHRGIVAALNSGLAAAKGNYIARMDADDLMFPSRLEKQISFLQAHPGIGLVSCLVEHGGDAQLQQGYATYISWINSLVSPEEISLNRFVESPLAHPSVLLRRELIEKYGSYREGNFPEDYELWLRFLDAGVQMAKVPEVLLRWNDPPGRLSRTDERYSPENFSKIKTAFLAKFIGEQLKESGRKLWLCGAGRITRQKSVLLIEAGLPVGGFVDVDPKKIGKMYNGFPVISMAQLGAKEEIYVVSFVGNRGAREMIRHDLKQMGFSEAADFLMAG